MSKKRRNVTNVTNPHSLQVSFQTFRKYVRFEATFRCRLTPSRTNPESWNWPSLHSRFEIWLGTTLRQHKQSFLLLICLSCRKQSSVASSRAHTVPSQSCLAPPYWKESHAKKNRSTIDEEMVRHWAAPTILVKSLPQIYIGLKGVLDADCTDDNRRESTVGFWDIETSR